MHAPIPMLLACVARPSFLVETVVLQTTVEHFGAERAFSSFLTSLSEEGQNICSKRHSDVCIERNFAHMSEYFSLNCIVLN